MAAIRLAMSATTANPNIGDFYIDPATGTDRLCVSLMEEVTQELWCRFRFFKGEWWLDPSQGVPWYQQILGIKNSDANVSAILKQVITTCPGVANLTSFNLNRTGRNISPTFSCTLANGTVLTSDSFGPFLIPGP